MAYQGLAFESELEFLSVNGRVCGVGPSEAYENAGLRFWRDVRQTGRRAGLALEGHPDLLAFWGADRDQLVFSAERLLRAHLADAVAARLKVVLDEVVQAPGVAGAAAADAISGDAPLFLDQILYMPFRLVFHVSPGVARGALDLYGFSCLVRDALAAALPEVLGCRGAAFIRVRSFLPSPGLIGAFRSAQAEQPAVRAVPEEAARAASSEVFEPSALSVPVAQRTGRDWAERFYQLLHPVPVFGFLAACYALFLMLSAEGARRNDSTVTSAPRAVEQTAPRSAGETAVPPAAETAERKVREDSPNVRYVPEN